MSLWTPGGEHEVPREPDEQAPGGQRAGAMGSPLDDLSPEEAEQARGIAEEMAEVRRQLSEVPASVVVANHVMGFYELAAIHLSRQPPVLSEAQVAIDAMGAVVEGLAGRLGEHETTLKDALGQIRLAYVQVRAATEGKAAGDDAAEAKAGDPSDTSDRDD